MDMNGINNSANTVQTNEASTTVATGTKTPGKTYGEFCLHSHKSLPALYVTVAVGDACMYISIRDNPTQCVN